MDSSKRGPRERPQFHEEEVETRPLLVDQKRLYFNVRRNERGRFLKIAEVNRNRRSTVIIPDSGWVQMRDMLNEFIAAARRDGDAVPPPAKPVQGGRGARTNARPPPRAARPAPRPAPAPAPPAPSKQLWVGNLPWSLSLADFRSLFESYGVVTKCELWQNRIGRPLGIGIVGFAEQWAADAALTGMHNTEVHGRAIRVRYDRFPDGSRGGGSKNSGGAGSGGAASAAASNSGATAASAPGGAAASGGAATGTGATPGAAAAATATSEGGDASGGSAGNTDGGAAGGDGGAAGDGGSAGGDGDKFGEIDIFVTDAQGTTVSLSVMPTATVGDVLSVTQDLELEGGEGADLVLAGRVLSADSTLRECGVAQKTVLELVANN